MTRIIKISGEERCVMCGFMSDHTVLLSSCSGTGFLVCQSCIQQAFALVSDDGAAMIYKERERQIVVEGYEADDDDHYTRNELVQVARSYLSAFDEKARKPMYFPWHHLCWKPKDRISNLVRAGALIAAEIDRLRRGHA